MSAIETLSGLIHMDNGSRIVFDAQGAYAEQIVNQLRKAPFSEPSLVLAAAKSIVILPPQRIERIDLDIPFDHSFGPLDLHGAEGMRREVEPEIWEELRLRRENDDVSRDQRVKDRKASLSVFGRLLLMSGRSVHLVHRIETPSLSEQHRYLREYFDIKAFSLQSLGSAMCLINPRQVVAATYYPGADPTRDTWRVNRVAVEGLDARRDDDAGLDLDDDFGFDPGR